jgi:hypothetical protein
MSDEKTLDELQAELENLKKENLEREIAKEKAKVDEALQLKKEKEAEELRNKIRDEVMAEFKGESKIETASEETVSEKPKYEVFRDNFVKKYGYGKKSYEDIAREISSPGNFKGERK